MNLIKPATSKIQKFFGWKPPSDNAFKLNTDAACFRANISISSVTNAKLWGLFYGLDLAWKQRIRDLLVEVNSKCSIQLIANTSNNPSSYSSLIRSIKELLNKDWHVCINHIDHEANFAVDFLTDFTKSQPLWFQFLRDPLCGLVPSLIPDMYGIAFPHFVLGLPL